MRCNTLDEVVGEVLRLIEEERSMHPESGAEFFFRGESKNYKSDSDSDILDTAFQSYLDRTGLQEYERQLYENALRFNVASFEDDQTMVERIARMQHYGLPTLDLFQDIATLHAHEMGSGLEYLYSIDRAWIMSRWRVRLETLPRCGDHVSNHRS